MGEKSSYDSEEAQSGLPPWKKRRSNSSFRRKTGSREYKDLGTELGEYTGLTEYLNNLQITPEEFKIGLKFDNERFAKIIKNEKIEKEPDFIDKQGIKYWLNYSITYHALKNGLNNILTFTVEHPDGCKTILLVRNNKLIFQSQLPEHIVTKIDTLATIKGKGFK